MKALYLSAILLFLVTPLFRYSSTSPASCNAPSQVQFTPSCCWWHPSGTVQPLLLLVTPLFRYSSTPPCFWCPCSGYFNLFFCWWSLLLSAVSPPVAVDAPAQVHKSLLLLATPLLSAQVQLPPPIAVAAPLRVISTPPLLVKHPLRLFHSLLLLVMPLLSRVGQPIVFCESDIRWSDRSRPWSLTPVASLSPVVVDNGGEPWLASVSANFRKISKWS